MVSNSYADTLYLKNGTQKDGKTISEDEEKVVFQIGGQDGVAVTYFQDDVMRLVKEAAKTSIQAPVGQGLQFDKLIGNIELPSDSSLESQSTQAVIAKTEENAPQSLDKESTGLKEEIEPILDMPSNSDIKNLAARENEIIQELMPLLDNKELDYFMRVTTITKDYAQNSLPKLSPTSLGSDPQKFQEAISNIPDEIQKTIEKIKTLDVPEIFINLNKKHIDNFLAIQDAFKTMASGDVMNAQSKMANIQGMSAELLKELEKILAEKKA